MKRQYKYPVKVPSDRRTLVELLAANECEGKVIDMKWIDEEVIYFFSFPKAALRNKFLRLWRIICEEDKRKTALEFLRSTPSV